MVSQARVATTTGQAVLSLHSIIMPLMVALFTATTYLFGDQREAVLALMVLSFVDLLSGVVAAGINGELHPAVGWKLAGMKFMQLLVVIVGNFADQATTGGPYFVLLALTYLTMNEALSILRNCDSAGVPFPKQLQGVLSQMRDKGDEPTAKRRPR